MSCATDEVLAAWAAGQVGGAERDSLDEHAAGCSLCRGVMMALAGVTRTAEGNVVAGDMVGRFQVIRRGDHTILARDPATNKDVAVRVVPATPETVREAEALSKLVHSALVRIVSVDLAGDELIVATEIVDGTPFVEWLSRSRSPAARAKVLAWAGRALNVLHSHRVTHGAFTRESIVVRRDGTGVIVGPAFGSTAKDDQSAWWRVVGETLGRPSSLRSALAKGLSEDPTKRYASMDAAVIALRNRAGDRTYVRWGGLGLVAIIAIGVITSLTASSNHLLKPDQKSSCVTATREWRAMRIPLIGKLGASGADTTRVIRFLDERTRRIATLQRDTCTNVTEQLCVDAVWHEHTALYPELISADPRVTRAAVDELVRLPAPDRCLHGMTGPKFAALRSKILHVELASLPPNDQVQQLQQLKVDVEALADEGVTARWHLAIGAAAVRGEDGDTARPELDVAEKSAKLSGDVDTFVRVLTLRIQIAEQVDATLEHRAEAAAATIDNPALTAELAHAEGIARSDADDSHGALVKLREAKRGWEAVAIDAHADLVDTYWLFAYELRRTGTPDDAAAIYDETYKLVRKRWGDDDHHTLLLREGRANNDVDRAHYGTARTEFVAVAEGYERIYGINEDVVEVRADICECDLAAKVETSSCDAALAVAVQAFGDHDARLIRSLDLVAQQALMVHRDEVAATACERALKLDTPTDHPVTQAHLAIALHRLHRTPARVKQLADAARSGLAEDSEAREYLDAELE